jgi:hypothetical protein
VQEEVHARSRSRVFIGDISNRHPKVEPGSRSPQMPLYSVEIAQAFPCDILSSRSRIQYFRGDYLETPGAITVKPGLFPLSLIRSCPGASQL